MNVGGKSTLSLCVTVSVDAPRFQTAVYSFKARFCATRASGPEFGGNVESRLALANISPCLGVAGGNFDWAAQSTRFAPLRWHVLVRNVLENWVVSDERGNALRERLMHRVKWLKSGVRGGAWFYSGLRGGHDEILG